MQHSFDMCHAGDSSEVRADFSEMKCANQCCQGKSGMGGSVWHPPGSKRRVGWVKERAGAGGEGEVSEVATPRPSTAVRSIFPVFAPVCPSVCLLQCICQPPYRLAAARLKSCQASRYQTCRSHPGEAAATGVAVFGHCLHISS